MSIDNPTTVRELSKSRRLVMTDQFATVNDLLKHNWYKLADPENAPKSNKLKDFMDCAIVEHTAGQDLIEELKRTRPDVAITVSRSIDHDDAWDGDGPDPRDEGFDAYDVDVKARTIRNGKLFTGTASLGGHYMKPEDEIGEIGGYLKQKVEEALAELDGQLNSLADIAKALASN